MMRSKGRPRILLIGPLPPPAGGIASAVSDLLNSDLVEDFKIVHVDNSTKRPISKKGKVDILNAVAFLLQSFLFLAKIMYYRPHIVQIETSSGVSFLKNSLFALMAKAAFRKVIISIHGSGLRFIQFYRNLPLIGKSYIKFVLSHCDIIRILSETWIHDFTSELELEESKICAIPNVIRVEDFGDSLTIKDRTNEITLLFLGWVGKKKGIFDLLDSVKILASKGYQFKLLIVGPEMEEGDLNRVKKAVFDKRLEERVEVLGEKDRSEALRYYHTADIYLLPSYTEGLPLCILEAMAAGLPVISTKVGAIPEVVEEGENGFLIEPGDVTKLASKIEILINNDGLREQMGINNIAKIQQDYTVIKQEEAFRKIYLRLLGRP